MTETLQVLMDKFDPKIKVELSIINYRMNAIASYKSFSYTVTFNRVTLGYENELYKTIIEILYENIKKSKIYIRSEKLNRLLK